MSIHTTTQEAVMSKSVPAQPPAVVLRSQYRNLRSLVAVLLAAVAALSATVAVVAIDDDGTTTSTSSVASSRSYPTLADPFQSQAEQPRRSGGPDESAVATAISPQAGVASPDESKIAAELAKRGQQQQLEAFVKGH
jgi:hypothetical protein